MLYYFLDSIPTVVYAGRQHIGVDQPPGGMSYPFVSPSYDVQNLLADFYLAYNDNKQLFVPPFRISWLGGFGDQPSDVPAGCVQVHPYDLHVVDANDRLVFGSESATAFRMRDWNASLQVIEFETADTVCRVVLFKGWSADDVPRNYDYNIVPDNGVLDSRTLELIPRRVRSIRLQGDPAAESGNLKFENGYNTTFVVTPPPANDGGRKVTTILAGAAPGSGLGRYPACDDFVPLSKINGIPGDGRGNFIISAADCLRVTQPSHIVAQTASLTPATVQISNDCSACSDCQDYRSVYEALRRQWASMVTIGHAAEAARDQYTENRKRWILSGRARQAIPLRLAVSPASYCRVSITGAYCNNGAAAIGNLKLRFSLVYSNGAYPDIVANTPGSGVPICGSAIRAGNFQRSSSMLAGRTSSTTPELYAMLGAWPTYEAQFDTVSSGGMAFVNFMLQFPSCDASQQAQVVLEAIDGDTGSSLTYFNDWPQNTEPLPVRPLLALAGFMPDDPCSI